MLDSVEGPMQRDGEAGGDRQHRGHQVEVERAVAGEADDRAVDAEIGEIRERPLQPLDTKRIQALVDQFRGRLAIPHRVSVILVERNPLIASVEADKKRRGAYLLSLERAFAETLSSEELQAIIAHELGHVWIFTHHPYLQTELLANQVAMRAVSRDALARVYGKVWKSGTKGDLVAFLGNAEQ